MYRKLHLFNCKYKNTEYVSKPRALCFTSTFEFSSITAEVTAEVTAPRRSKQIHGPATKPLSNIHDDP